MSTSRVHIWGPVDIATDLTEYAQPVNANEHAHHHVVSVCADESFTRPHGLASGAALVLIPTEIPALAELEPWGERRGHR
jgi:hypothetical protein